MEPCGGPFVLHSQAPIVIGRRQEPREADREVEVEWHIAVLASEHLFEAGAAENLPAGAGAGRMDRLDILGHIPDAGSDRPGRTKVPVKERERDSAAIAL